jgi:hypothetical protein
MRKTLTAAALSAIALSPSLALAEQPMEHYQARLSHADHFTSTGARLEGVAEILRQDRVNYYTFEMRDPEDQPDAFFASPANRMKLETLIANGNLTAAVREEIVYGTPIVEVVVYHNHIDLELKPER